MQPLRERSRELFSTFSLRYRSNQVCSAYPYFRTLLDYLNEKHMVSKLYYASYLQYITVQLGHMDSRFAEEVILPWIDLWAKQNYRAVMNPHLHACEDDVLVEVPLTMYENNAIQEMVRRLEEHKGGSNSLEALQYLGSLHAGK